MLVLVLQLKAQKIIIERKCQRITDFELVCEKYE